MSPPEDSPAEKLLASLMYVSGASGRQMWSVWEPGDSTRYRVLIVRAYPTRVAPRLPSTVLSGLLITVDEGWERDQSIVVMAPNHDYQKWSAALWLQRGYPAGWWGAVRPLLSVMDWVVPEEIDSTYSPQAAVDIGVLLNAREGSLGDDLV